ncbi:cytochrome P450 [Actinokineospora sp.]|uniref:cytochrome P450 n=1 Tax=Actinokineospora sp. TaxID=1872133 RepID=UPI004038050F
MPTLDQIDITSETIYDDQGYPWAAWDQLRQEAPAYWYQRPNYEPFWALTKHADIEFVSRNTQLFSCAQRTAIETPEEIEPWETERERRAQANGHRPDYPAALGYMDAPLHRDIRGAMYSLFTPGATAKREADYYELAREHVADFTARLDAEGTADIAHDLSARLPLAALFELLGAPRADWDRLFDLHKDTVSAFHKDFQEDGEDAQRKFFAAMMELDGYMSTLVRERMANAGNGGDDVLSKLVNARVGRDPLRFHDISYQLFNLVQAGNSTVRNVVAGGVDALLRNPDQLRRLIDDPSLLDSAIDEMLRWTSTGIAFLRTARQDVEIRGSRIRKGDTVALFFPSANRDEDVFTDPYRFDIARTPNRHLAFGANGEHRCVGANMAKVELRAMFRALLPVLPTLEIAGDPKLITLHLIVSEYVRVPVRRKS